MHESIQTIHVKQSVINKLRILLMIDNLKAIIIGLVIVLIAVFAITFYYVFFFILFIVLSLTIGRFIILARNESQKE